MNHAREALDDVAVDCRRGEEVGIGRDGHEARRQGQGVALYPEPERLPTDEHDILAGMSQQLLDQRRRCHRLDLGAVHHARTVPKASFGNPSLADCTIAFGITMRLVA